MLYDDYKRAYGQDDPDLLVWVAPSALMNPSLTAERLDRERRLDPQRFAREYLGEFAEDLDVFLPGDWIEQAVVPGRHELPATNQFRYVAAVDPSGGGADAFTLAICHAEGSGTERRVVQDVMKGWTRRGSEALDLQAVVSEIAAIVKRYYLSAVVGDRYGGQWVRDAFRSAGITYREASVRAPDGEEKYLDKSTAYAEVQPLFAQQKIALLDHPLLVRELKLLEARPRAGGRTLVDHPSGMHDDHANALALAAALCASTRSAPYARAALDGIARVGRPLQTSAGQPIIGGRAGGQIGGQVARGTQVGGQAAYIQRNTHRIPLWS